MSFVKDNRSTFEKLFFQNIYQDIQIFYLSATYIMLGSQVYQGPPHTSFKKGMTLDEYLSQMQTVRPSEGLQQKVQQDLYATSKKNQASLSKKIITYQIRESQQDDYQESQEQNTLLNQNIKHSVQFGQKQQRLSNKNILLNFPGAEVKASLSNSRGFRVRKQSNSPFNQHKKDLNGISPNKNFAMTLFNGQWKNTKQSISRSNNPSTTLYGKFLKGVKQFDEVRPKVHSKEKYFQKKNTQQLENVIKYQKGIQQKYNRVTLPQTLDMRVQGVTDRLHDRKVIPLKNHK